MNNDKIFNWNMNVFEYVLGYTSDEWKELNTFLNNYGDDKNEKTN